MEFLTALLLFTNNCPNLAGSYRCLTGETFSISQSKVGEHTLYNIGGAEFLADGIRKSKKKGWYEFVDTVKCENDQLIIMDEQISDEHSTHETKSYRVKESGKLVINYKYLEIDEGHKEVYKQTFHCPRND